MGRMSRVGNDLYNGKRSLDFIHKRWLWYGISGLLVALAVVAVTVKGLNFGVEFTGGSQFQISNLTATDATQTKADDLREAVAAAGIRDASSATVTTSGDSALTLVTEDLTQDESTQVRTVIADVLPNVTRDDVSQTEIGPSWGQEVAQRAAIGVGVFLILVVLFIWAYFREWKMSVAALVALFHDIAITIGIYALSGFQVTPSAVTGLLAILGFSLYDTVVVFDKIKENTGALRKKTQSYQDAANLAVNQTLVRSINTGIVALIPIGAILYVSAVQLGASSLQDLALSQFVGMAVGVYSSVAIAPRVLVQLKGREADVKEMERRAKARARREVDRYATVPAFAEGLPIEDPNRSPDELEGFYDDDEDDEDDEADEAPTTRGRQPAGAGSRPPAAGRGRTVPTANRPVRRSGSAGRQQPTRQTRSKRGGPGGTGGSGAVK